MSRKLFFIIITLFLFFSFLTWAHAQETPEFDFNRAYQDYLYTYGQYREAHNEYVTAKEQYLNYKTLTAKTLALEQALAMLQARDETLKTYLTALRMKMAETTGISSYKQNTHYLKLDAEVAWYAEHREELVSAATLEDLVDSSKKAESRHGKTEVLSYQALGLIFEGKETNLKSQQEEQIDLIKEKLEEIDEKGDKGTSTAERWLLEAENKLTRSQEKMDEAMGILNEMKPSDRNKLRDYNEAQKLFQESHLYLQEANSYLKELIHEIKTAD